MQQHSPFHLLNSIVTCKKASVNFMVLKKSPILNYGHICKNEARECILRAVCVHSFMKHLLGSHQLPVFCQHFNKYRLVCWFSVWFGFPYFLSLRICPHSAVMYPREHNTREPCPQKVRSPLWSQTWNTQGSCPLLSHS